MYKLQEIVDYHKQLPINESPSEDISLVATDGITDQRVTIASINKKLMDINNTLIARIESLEKEVDNLKKQLILA